MKNIKKIIYNFIRHFVKNNLTGNLGKVVETDEKLICYVNKRKCEHTNYRYIIACFGIRQNDKKLADSYNLNKPICYIIDGIKFDKDTYIFGYDNCEIYIKECEFCLGAYIRVNGKCIIENTDIKALNSLMISAEDLILKNIDLNNYYRYSSNLIINLGAIKKMEIINSLIGRKKEKTNVSILSTNELNVINSKIAGDVVESEADKMIYDSQSSISASNVRLKVNEFKKIYIASPNIVLNGINIFNEKESIVLEKIEDPLKIKRIELIEILKKLKNESEQRNAKKVEIFKNTLNNHTIARTLKRK